VEGGAGASAGAFAAAPRGAGLASGDLAASAAVVLRDVVFPIRVVPRFAIVGAL
jgi:hypothetical protein